MQSGVSHARSTKSATARAESQGMLPAASATCFAHKDSRADALQSEIAPSAPVHPVRADAPTLEVQDRSLAAVRARHEFRHPRPIEREAPPSLLKMGRSAA